jgi:hypothetical protein
MPTRLLISSVLLATSAFADSAVVSSGLEARGFTSAKSENADFTVTVAYKIPGVIADSDTYSFKRYWSKVTHYADGTMSAMRPGSSWSGKCRDGVSVWCNGAANVQVEDTGPKVILDLSWGGKQSGHLKREFSVPWSELDKTIKGKEVEIHVNVRYHKA